MRCIKYVPNFFISGKFPTLEILEKCSELCNEACEEVSYSLRTEVKFDQAEKLRLRAKTVLLLATCHNGYPDCTLSAAVRLPFFLFHRDQRRI
ncbi:hypothetical protein TNCV_2788011 [Trichonephila clavipes]|uniref:Uncharacterized protein n=1 Tax=Trichonephila clavipes TaxID=2585209 RepID=A0A8X6SS66_TRICX|nr:hypothetical protein TNCV_2788011 [Trichonephila clavipes]